MSHGFIIGLTKEGRPTLYLCREYLAWDVQHVWREKITTPKYFPDRRSLDDKLKELLDDFEKGKGEYSAVEDGGLYVGKVVSEDDPVYDEGTIVGGLRVWTSIGEVIPSDFQIRIFEVKLEEAEIIVPEVTFVKSDIVPDYEPPQLPKQRYVETRNIFEGDDRKIAATYIVYDPNTGRKQKATFTYPVKLSGHAVVTKVNDLEFKDSVLAPEQFVALLTIQLNSLQ